MGERVAVVGAGYAGMAAAVTLAGRGIPVTVFEAGTVPGGRARRVISQGNELDNGQHVLIGAYSELFRLMRIVGVPDDAVLRVPLEIRYFEKFHFRALWLPFPFGLLGGLLLARGIRFSERVAAIRFMAAMRRARFRIQPDISVEELLNRHAQGDGIGHYLWRPLCVSALNTPTADASARAFLVVLRDTLFGEPLEELKKQFQKIVVAVGPHQLKTLLPDVATEYSYQPIYTCYLQYPEHVKRSFPMLGLADGLVQWVFDRGRLTGERGLLACVISAQGDHQQLSLEELAERCHRELARALPGLPQPAWWRVIAEKRATIACVPGVKRPASNTNISNVFLAGDYTDPEYPPTLEAAVRSGVRAAQGVL